MSHSHTLKRLERIKTVGLWGGVCLLFNSMSGPAIPYTATVFQTLGVLIPFVLFLLFAVVSAFAVLFIVEAMQAIPGNKHFQGTVEFATLINFYFPAWGHILAQVILYGAIQSQAIQSVVLVSQAVDGIFVDIFKHSCGLTQTFQWQCIDNSSGGLFPNSMLFTLGFLATLVMCIPLARSKMDDNISVQVVAFCVTLLVVADWFTESLFDFQKKRVPFLKFEPAFGVLIGPVILNFSCAMFAPSWVNLKRKSINTQRTIWITMAMAIVIFGIVGLMPAYGFDGLGIKSLTDNSVNLLTILTNQSNTRLHLVANKVFCYIFNFSMLWPSIPFGCIVSETNIVQNFESKSRWFRPGVQFLCYVLPWFLAIPLLTGPLLGTIQNWCSILLAGPANFIIPFLVYLRCLNFRKEYNEHRTLSEKQRKILLDVHKESTRIHSHLNSVDDAAGSAVGFLGRAVTKVMGRMGSRVTTGSPQVVKVDWTDGTEEETGGGSGLLSPKTAISPMLSPAHVADSLLGSSLLRAEAQALEDAESDEEGKATSEFWLEFDVPDPEREYNERMKGRGRASEKSGNPRSISRSRLRGADEERPIDCLPSMILDRGFNDAVEETIALQPSTSNSYSTFADAGTYNEEEDDELKVSGSSGRALGRKGFHITKYMNEGYVSPAFRAVPEFFPFSAPVLAMILMGIMGVLLMAVLVCTAIAASETAQGGAANGTTSS